MNEEEKAETKKYPTSKDDNEKQQRRMDSRSKSPLRRDGPPPFSNDDAPMGRSYSTRVKSKSPRRHFRSDRKSQKRSDLSRNNSEDREDEGSEQGDEETAFEAEVLVEEELSDDDTRLEDRPGAFREGTTGHQHDEEEYTLYSNRGEEAEPTNQQEENDPVVEAVVAEERDLEKEVQQLMEKRTVEATSVKKLAGNDPDDNSAPTTRPAVVSMSKPRSVIVLMVLAFVIIVIAIIILALVVVRSNSSNKKTSGPTSSTTTDPSTDGRIIVSTEEPTVPPTPFMMSDLDFAKDLFIPISGEEALSNSSSVQYKALWWMVHEDPTNTIALMRSHHETEEPSSWFLKIIERYVIVLFYFATGGHDWYFQWDFLGNSSICEWSNTDGNNFGIQCNDGGSVMGIALDSNHLNGTLPSELSALSSSLEYLSITDCFLHGTFPPSLGKLTRLKVFQLFGNHLGGSIPESFSQLRQLEWLNIHSNELTGSIPTGLMEISSLDGIALMLNYITGPIPSNISMGEKMGQIWLGGNMITGSIPESIYSPTLEFFSAWGNSITGTLLSERAIGNLKQLKILNVEMNEMIGTIPYEIGTLSNLETLIINANSFSGTIPSEIGLLTRLHMLFMHENLFSGTVPAEFSTFSDTGGSITLYANNLTGSLDMFCNQTTTLLFARVEADCAGVEPLVDCPCCVRCCDPASGECTTDVQAVCAIDLCAIDQSTVEYQAPESDGTVCECSKKNNDQEEIMNMTTTTPLLSCADTQCQSCNKDQSICSITENFHFEYNPDGNWKHFQFTFQYVVGRNDTVVLDIEMPDDELSCQVSVNGQICNSCMFVECGDGFRSLLVLCENVPGAGFVHICDQNHIHADGPLAVFLLVDPTLLLGCPPIKFGI